jgi:hypothetical protein
MGGGLRSTAAALAVSVILAGQAAADGVSVSVTIGTPAPPPPPPIVVAAPPRFVVIPGSPVRYAPDVGFNLFVHDGRHFTFHAGVWFSTVRPGGAWVMVPVEKVPKAVLAVPVAYYKIPPGHAKGHAGPPPWAGPEKKHHKKWKDKD